MYKSPGYVNHVSNGKNQGREKICHNANPIPSDDQKLQHM